MTPTTIRHAPPAALVRTHTLAWLDRAVIGLNLCPFAKAVRTHGQIRLRISRARTPQRLLQHLAEELQHLLSADPLVLDTSLLVHPQVLGDFAEFNDFLDPAEALVEAMGLEGTVQLAPFHPAFRFAGTRADAIDHCTNRSPYPMLHLLREASVARAVAAVPDAAAIYERNIRTLRRLGRRGWRELFADMPGMA